MYERMYERIGEQIDVSCLHVIEEKVEVARLIHQERSQQETVPQIQEHNFEAIKVIPQERVSVLIERLVDLVQHVVRDH